MNRSICVPLAILFGTITATGFADVTYQIDDGTAEFTLGIDPGEDMVWMNSFPVQPGGEVITSISASFGRPGLNGMLNGLAIEVLLYEDLNGGSPQDAILRAQTSGIVANGDTNVQNVYPIVPTEVHGDLVATILFRNTTSALKFIGAVDRTEPSFSDRSYTGFAVGLDPLDLMAIPDGQFRTIEGFGITGNFSIRAVGQPIPEPGLSCGALIVLCCFGIARMRNPHYADEDRPHPV